MDRGQKGFYCTLSSVRCFSLTVMFTGLLLLVVVVVVVSVVVSVVVLVLVFVVFDTL